MTVKQDLPSVRGDDDDAAFHADIVQMRKNLYYVLLHIPGYDISVHSTLIQYTPITYTKYDTYTNIWLAWIKSTVLFLWQGAVSVLDLLGHTHSPGLMTSLNPTYND